MSLRKEAEEGLDAMELANDRANFMWADHLNEFEKSIEQLRAALNEPDDGWISVDDPPDSNCSFRCVVSITNDDYNNASFYAHWTAGVFMVLLDGEMVRVEGITGWMPLPLPSAPKEKL